MRGFLILLCVCLICLCFTSTAIAAKPVAKAKAPAACANGVCQIPVPVVVEVKTRVVEKTRVVAAKATGAAVSETKKVAHKLRAKCKRALCLIRHPLQRRH
jgi:hypothetical protein